MIVHNDIRRDARVMKEANSLGAAGHEVTVFGLTDKPGDTDFSFGSHRIPAVLSYRSDVGVDPSLLRNLPLACGIDSEPIASALHNYLESKAVTKPDRIRRRMTYQGAILADAVCRAARPDVVHIHDHVALTAAPVYKYCLAVPLVWDAHELYEELAGVDPDRAKAHADVIAQHSQYIDKFITINDSIATYYAEKYPHLSNSTVLPNASLSADLPTYDGRLHEAAGITSDQKILLFQGGISSHRGVAELVAAAKNFSMDWSLVFMGWGPLKEQMQSLAANYPATSTGNPRVSFVNGVPQDELALWTAGASLGAITYENTGLNHLYCTPNKLWEYPLAGVPILATDLEEIGRTLREYGIGRIIPRDFTAQDISQTVNELKRQDLDEMREKCRLYATKQNWQANEHLLTEMYSGIADLLDSNQTSWKSFSLGENSWPKPNTKVPQAGYIAEAGMKKVVGTTKATVKSSGPDSGNIVLNVLRFTKDRFRLLFQGASDEEQVIAKLEARRGQMKTKIGKLEARTELLKDKLQEARNASRNTASADKAKKAMADQLALLKNKLDAARKQLHASRIDQRDINPSQHNTVTSMDAFFSKDGSEEPYIDFAISLRALLDDHDISIDGKELLDVGIGNGAMLQSLLTQAKPKSVTGLDFSPVAIEKAKQRIPQSRLEVSDIYEPISYTADLVICTEVLEHLEQPAVALQNVLNAVKPGGCAVLTVPDGRIDYARVHINFWSPESWRHFILQYAKSLDVTIGQFRVRYTSPYANNFAIIRRIA